MAFLTSVSAVFAYSPEVVDPGRPFDVIAVSGNLQQEQEFLGKLNNFPEMYEVVSQEPFDLTFKIRQGTLNEPEPIGLIAVKVDERGRGVTEIIRLNKPAADWSKFYSKGLGLSFIESDTISVPVEAGTYRIEVSTPNNRGDYLLILGSEPNRAGYFSTLGSVYKTQQHFGYSVFRLIVSPYYFIPLILVLTGITIYLQRRRKNIYA